MHFFQLFNSALQYISGTYFRLCTISVCIFTILSSFFLINNAGAQSPLLVLTAGKGQLVQVPGNAKDVFIADPRIANVQVPSPDRIYIVAKKPGETTLTVLNDSGQILIDRDVRVIRALGRIQSELADQFPEADVRVRDMPNRVVLEGTVRTAIQSREISEIAKGVVNKGSTLVNRLKVTGPTQVNLKVRVAEVSRQVTRRFGFNLQALFQPGNFSFLFGTGRDFFVDDGSFSGQANESFLLPDSDFGSAGFGYDSGSANFDAVLDALAADGLVTTLAEPNLTAISGETANFLAGGEFPIPIQDDDGISITFKKFGVALAFTPTILSEDRISLLVEPEVSDIDTAASINVGGVRIPGLSVRRVKTTVELGSGQSFAIGGLIQNDIQDSIDRFPFLSDVPILGQLFTSTAFRKNQSELIAVVTPYVVEPTAADDEQEPLANLTPNVRVERLLRQSHQLPRRSKPNSSSAAPMRLYGPAGHAF